MNGYEKFGKKRRQWEDSGVHELIKLWKCCAYELRTIKRNGHLYVAMAKQLSALGVPVTALEVHFKVNNLTQRYRQESKTYEATGIVSTWKFYSLVDDVFKSLGHSSAGFKQQKRIMTPAISLGSMSESSVWKSPMSQQEFTNNTEGFYKSEYAMSSRHYLEHSQTPNPNDVNFMAAASASSRMNENNIDQMSGSTNEANSSAAPGGGGGGGAGGGSGFADRLSKMKKSEDYDKFVDIVKNIVDNHKSTPDKADAFSDFIKSYLKRWPDRLQDEAINHITNYIIVKNMEHTLSSTASGANRQ